MNESLVVQIPGVHPFPCSLTLHWTFFRVETLGPPALLSLGAVFYAMRFSGKPFLCMPTTPLSSLGSVLVPYPPGSSSEFTPDLSMPVVGVQSPLSTELRWAGLLLPTRGQLHGSGVCTEACEDMDGFPPG